MPSATLVHYPTLCFDDRLGGRESLLLREEASSRQSIPQGTGWLDPRAMAPTAAVSVMVLQTGPAVTATRHLYGAQKLTGKRHP